eukprot:1196113-Prorocentrum_minimum.AAC.12
MGMMATSSPEPPPLEAMHLVSVTYYKFITCCTCTRTGPNRLAVPTQEFGAAQVDSAVLGHPAAAEAVGEQQRAGARGGALAGEEGRPRVPHS